MGGKSKPSGEQTVTNRTELPEWLTPSLKGATSYARDLYSAQEPLPYPGQTVAPFAPQTLDALQMTEDTARAGVPGTGAALDTYQRMMGGDYLYGGEGFNAALDAAQRDIMPRVQSAFGTAGRNQSGLAQAAMAEQLGDAFAGMYNQERQRQTQGLALAPQMDALAYQPAANLAQVGGTFEGKAAEEMADAQARYEQSAYAPQVALDRYISRIQGVAPFGGQTSTQSTPLYQNRAAGALGGAASGLGLANSLGASLGGAGLMGPWGLALGGGLGLLGGLL